MNNQNYVAIPERIEFKPKRILCPVDYSDLSTLALKYAYTGARLFNSELLVIHAVGIEPPPYFSATELGQIIENQKRSIEHERVQLSNYVKTVLGQESETIKIEYEVVDSPPAEAIIKTSAERKADLIVIGTHGKSKAKALLLGSVAEAVIRQSQVPVLAVRESQHAVIDLNNPQALPAVNQILCPVNSSKTAKTGMSPALSLAEMFNAHLNILYVVESSAETLGEATEALCSWMGPELKPKCVATYIVRKGKAPKEIIRYALETRQDLIVLCADKTKQTYTQIFGSTTDDIIRNAPVPVLVVPFDEKN